MAWIILFLFLLLIAWLSIIADRRWQVRASAPKQPRPANAAPADLVAQIAASWRQRLPWGQRSATPSLLPTRLNYALTNSPAEKAWLEELNPAQWQALDQQLTAFCAAFTLDLAWLGEPLLAKDPALEQALHTIVLHYCQAYRQAAQVQSDAFAFQAYWRMEHLPYSYEQQPLIQQLYTQLAAAGLTNPVRPEALLATEKIRQEHLLQAIHAAAEHDYTAFKHVLQAVINPPITPAPAPPSAVAASVLTNVQTATP